MIERLVVFLRPNRLKETLAQHFKATLLYSLIIRKAIRERIQLFKMKLNVIDCELGTLWVQFLVSHLIRWQHLWFERKSWPRPVTGGEALY